MARKKEFPATMYAKLERDVNGPDWFRVDRVAADLAEIGKTIEVGVYKLVEVKRLVTKPELVR